MNVLRVIASMDPSTGGPCQGIRNSISELQKMGENNEVVCLDSPSATFFTVDNFTIHPLGLGVGPWNYSKNLLGWLMENLGRFDAVIVHGLWLYHSFAVKIAVSRFKKSNKKVPKFFIMPHGMLDPYFQHADGRKLKAIRNWVYWKFIEGGVIQKADGVLFTCEAELLLAKDTFRPYHPRKEINIGYGIKQPPSFTSKMSKALYDKCPEIKNRPYFLFLSRIHEKKGVELLIKAYTEIFFKNRKQSFISNDCSVPLVKSDVSQNSDQNLTPLLIVAGPGLDSSYGRSLLQIVKDSRNLKATILFPGMLTGDAKWGAFYGCEAFVLPSHQENFGIAVVEALACQKPVLISKQVNIWKEIESAGCGLVDEDTLEGTMKLFNSWNKLSKADIKAMGISAGIAYKNFFSINQHVRNLIKAIQ